MCACSGGAEVCSEFQVAVKPASRTSAAGQEEANIQDQVDEKGACQRTASCITQDDAGSCYNSLMSELHQMQRESLHLSQIRERLPEFADACAPDVDVILFHLDAFAADYQDEQYKLLGAAK
jgi:hypothetical protein